MEVVANQAPWIAFAAPDGNEGFGYGQNVELVAAVIDVDLHHLEDISLHWTGLPDAAHPPEHPDSNGRIARRGRGVRPRGG